MCSTLGNYDPYFVYMVRCQNGAIYTGIAKNLEDRIKVHNSGKGSKSCRAHGLPVKLECAIEQPNKSMALKLEYKIKQLSRKHKQQFIDAAKVDSNENPIEEKFIAGFSKSNIAMKSLTDQKKEMAGLCLYMEAKILGNK